MLDAKGRTDKLFAAIIANVPKKNLGAMSGDPSNPSLQGTQEYDRMYQQLYAIFGAADLGYFVQNATVLPGSLVAPSGASVATTGGPAAQSGFVTSSSPLLSGTGRLS